MNELTQQEQEFVKEVALSGNQTQAAKKAYGIENDDYARLKGHRLIIKDNIVKAVEEIKMTLAERIPDELLHKVLVEGLEASKTIKVGDTETVEPDHPTRHKFLDTGLKIKGAYAPEKSIALNVNADITNPKARELADKYEEELKKNI